MTRIFLTAAAALLTLPAAHAASLRLVVRGAWSRPAAAHTVGVGYMTLVNEGARPAVLIGARTPMAGRVEMHRSRMANGIMTMAPVARVTAPPGGSVVFAPGGYHLMFIGLKMALRPGDSLPATLIFADGRRIAIRFAVGEGGPPAVVTKK